MTQQEKTNPIRARVMDEGIPPPPRLLLWLVIGGFLIFVIGAIVLISFLQNPSVASLLDLGIKLVPIVTVGTLLLAVIFRKQLPRRALPGLIIGWLLIWIVGGVVFILIFRNALAPGQRETVKSYLPFMSVFAPPVPPADTSLPTPIPSEGEGISPADLLNSGPFGGAPAGSPTAELTVEVQPTATPTLEPTVTPTEISTQAATHTPIPTATTVPTQAAVIPPTEVSNVLSVDPSLPVRPVFTFLTGFTYVKQDWNNCGPANITMALSYYGWKQSMDFAASYLRPDREDKNVSPWEMVAFVNEQSAVRALTRIGGDMELIKQFIANGFPVVVESVLNAEAYDWIGHYETIVGYDDSAGAFYIYDSYVGTGENGNGLADPYERFDRAWQNFNRTFIVIYNPEDENTVRTILGERADVNRAAEIAAETARSEARTNPQDAFAWFNLGTALTRLGQYEQAAGAYDQARRLDTLPWRITLYQFGIFEAYFQVGRYNELMALLEANLRNGGEYVEETYYWQGKALAAQGDNANAAAAFRQALSHNPNFTAAQDELDQLPV